MRMFVSLAVIGVLLCGNTTSAATVTYSQSPTYQHLATMMGQYWDAPSVLDLLTPGYISVGRGRHGMPGSSAWRGSMRSLLAFDLTGIPDASTIDAVTLQMTIYGYEDAGSTPPLIEVHEIAASTTMVESEVSWPNVRAATPWATAGGDYLSAVLSSASGDASPSPGEVVSFSSTPSFALAAQGASNAGSPLELILLSPDAEADTGTQQRWHHFADDIHSNASWRPRLTVEYTVIPEPSTLVVCSSLTLCGIVIGWRRRRKAA